MKATVFLLLFLMSVLLGCKYEAEKESPLPDEEQPIVKRDIGTTEEEVIRNLKSCVTYADILSFLPDERGKYNNVWSRRLDYGVEQIYEDIFFGKERHGRVNMIYLVESDTIRLGYIINIKNDSIISNKNEFFQVDTAFLKLYLKMHNHDYNIDLTLKELIDDFIDETLGVQIACGNATSSYSSIAKAIYLESDQLGKSLSLKLLKSASPEKQAYGAIGLQRVQRLGGDLTFWEKRIIRYLRLRNTKVTACRTCVGGKYDFNEIVDLYSNEGYPNVKYEHMVILKPY